jgi:hypothetical protein
MKEKSKGPIFFCIGPEKTGTTWLWVNLKNHPDIFLPNKKEIRYFLESHLFKKNEISLLNRFRKMELPPYKEFIHERFNSYLNERVKFYFKNLSKINLNFFRDICWDFKYLFFPHNDNWYLSLFKHPHKKISGEISPIEALLPEEQIEHLKTLLPGLKIIIILRDPIERVWSKAKMNLMKLQKKIEKIEDISEAEFYLHFDREFSKMPGYFSLIRKWSAFFQADQIHINFYDKLSEQPAEFLRDICEFINVDFKKFSGKSLEKSKLKVFEGLKTEFPDKFKTYLMNQYKDSIKELSGYFNPYPQKWFEKYYTDTNG